MLTLSIALPYKKGQDIFTVYEWFCFKRGLGNIQSMLIEEVLYLQKHRGFKLKPGAPTLNEWNSDTKLYYPSLYT